MKKLESLQSGPDCHIRPDIVQNGRSYPEAGKTGLHDDLDGKARVSGSDHPLRKVVIVQNRQNPDIQLIEESKNGKIYGFVLATNSECKQFGWNSWYFPNWVRPYAIDLMQKLADEIERAKTAKSKACLMDVVRRHKTVWREWLQQNRPDL